MEKVARRAKPNDSTSPLRSEGDKEASSPASVTRVAFVVTRLEGGIGRNVIRLATGLRDQGIRVALWLGEAGSDYDHEVPGDVEVAVLPTTHAWLGVLPVAYMMSRQAPSVVVTPNERLTRLCFFARRLSRHQPALVARVHNFYTREYIDLPPVKLKRRRRRLAAIYPRLDAVVGVSHGVTRDFAAFVGRQLPNMSAIYNPVVGGGLLERGGGIDVPRNEPVIVTVGRLVPQKNIAFLLESFLQLRQRRACRLLIIGDGAQRKELEAMAHASSYPDDVVFLGQQPDPFQYMETARVFALTSVFEGFGNVVVESLACGTPVVSTASGGPEEILAHSELGQIVRSDRAIDFADALESWLDCPVDHSRLRKYALAHFSVAEIADRYHGLFESVVVRRSENS